MTRYLVTKQFNTGVLAGLAFTINSPVPFTVGQTYRETACAGSFVVTACRVTNSREVE